MPVLGTETRIERLNGGQEYRFEVDFDVQVDVRLKGGFAEIFGTEITKGPVFSFSGTKVAVFTWQGCELEVTGSPASAYTSEDTPMMAYFNLHHALEARRGLRGPRVMIIGPPDSGKTSLIKILASYALKYGRNPLLLNLDPREGMSTLAGTISAVPITNRLDVTTGFGASASTGASERPPKAPVAYCYGSDSPLSHRKYYKHLMTRLAVVANSRLSLNANERATGLLIDTAGLIDQTQGYDIIDTTIKEFDVDTVVCIGSERLAQDMIRKYDGKEGKTVVVVPKSGGCVGRDDLFCQKQQAQRTREYFYGDLRQPLNPHTITVAFDEVRMYSVEDSMGVNTSLMPAGHDFAVSKTFVTPCEVNSLLLNTLVALVHAESRDTLESLSTSNVLGYVLVTDVDDEKKRMTLLAPFQGRLPAKGLVVTSYRIVL